jgi:hypothetical protein
VGIRVVPHDGRKHGQRGADVQQACQRQRGHVTGQLRRRRRGGTEEQGGQQAPEDTASGHRPSVPPELLDPILSPPLPDRDPQAAP